MLGLRGGFSFSLLQSLAFFFFVVVDDGSFSTGEYDISKSSWEIMHTWPRACMQTLHCVPKCFVNHYLFCCSTEPDYIWERCGILHPAVFGFSRTAICRISGKL